MNSKYFTLEYWKRKKENFKSRNSERLHSILRKFRIGRFPYDEIKFYLYNYIISYIPSNKVRLFYLRNILGFKINKNAFIHLGCFFLGNNIEIGDDTVIGRDCVIVGNVKIANHCSISAYTIIQSVTHDKNSPTFKGFDNPIFIDDYVWTGFRTIILSGSNISKGVIIGANSTFIGGETEPFTVYAGSPAIKVSERDEKACVYELNYHPKFN